MLTCINKNSLEFQTMLKQSGLEEFDLESQIRNFEEKYGRWPNLDEIRGANSLPYVSDFLHLSKDDSVNTEELVKTLGVSTIEEVNPELNDRFRDYIWDAVPIIERSKVFYHKRPTVYDNIHEDDQYDPDENINMHVLLSSISNNLSRLFNVQIIPVTNEELSGEEWQQVPGVQSAKAFIFNNNIYVNTDICTPDSQLHEMLHLVFGSIKYSQPDLYYGLVQNAQNFKSFQNTAKLYPNRTMGDVLEEVFITELAKYLTGQESDIPNLESNIQYEIFYNMNRLLDSIFIGGISVNSIPNSTLYNLNLKQIAKIVNSAALNNTFRGSMTDAQVNRIMANVKSDLMRKGELREDCV